MRSYRLGVLVALLLTLALASGCVSDGDATILVEGEVLGESFSATAGTAEQLQSGSYVLTLSNSPSYTCTSSPSSSTLQVVIDGFSSTGEFQAADRVSFNSEQDGVIEGESATSGRVFVEILDSNSPPTIAGDLNAAGPNSQVSGTFEVPICD